MKPAIRVENLSKMYRLGAQGMGNYQDLRETITGTLTWPARKLWQAVNRNAVQAKPPESEDEEALILWALKDVSFEIKPGEVVGIIGRNGAGKSTLLKILSRIVEPTSGHAQIHGRIGSLLEVGTGFHPDLSGRENVYLNGSLLGMSRKEIQKKFDEIVAFSEIERFIDTPVKRYSSGMYVRLAFAVAAHLEPEILIVDEVLAVGDSNFQRKCLRKMNDIGRSGRTIIFVSHNLASVRALCQKALYMMQGKVISYGPADEQVASYLSDLSSSAAAELGKREDREGTGVARFTGISIFDQFGNVTEHIPSGSEMKMEFHYICSRPGANANEIALSLWNMEGVKIFHVDNLMHAKELPKLNAEGTFTCTFPKIPLVPGNYHINILINVDGSLSDHIYSALTFQIVESDYYKSGKPTSPRGGLVFLEHQWA